MELFFLNRLFTNVTRRLHVARCVPLEAEMCVSGWVHWWVGATEKSHTLTKVMRSRGIVTRVSGDQAGMQLCLLSLSLSA